MLCSSGVFRRAPIRHTTPSPACVRMRVHRGAAQPSQAEPRSRGCAVVVAPTLYPLVHTIGAECGARTGATNGAAAVPPAGGARRGEVRVVYDSMHIALYALYTRAQQHRITRAEGLSHWSNSAPTGTTHGRMLAPLRVCDWGNAFERITSWAVQP